ncbi:MAG: 2-C-methyl-D-erythritol 4-phosphate cytidylyltransferase, partial [Paludibacteraceae bacterium]|nr:2-C-methyl-D-erythritol 4-phosphate cytidylyltransferase [Paludibacteraceae bacterium]
SVIEDAFKTAEEKGSAVPVVDCTDSVRIVSEDGCSNAPIDRSRVKMVQTPQVFRASILKQAYDVEFSPLFTDDASVVEHAGHKIYLTRGDIKNKKITYISDIKF